MLFELLLLSRQLNMFNLERSRIKQIYYCMIEILFILSRKWEALGDCKGL